MSSNAVTQSPQDLLPPEVRGEDTVRIVKDHIEAQCPVDGRPLPPVAVTPAAELPALVAKARAAQSSWQLLSGEERVAALLQGAKQMLRNRAQIIELVRLEIGKLENDALFSEALGPVDQVKGWASVIAAGQKRRKVRLNPVAFPKKRAYYDRLPRGVVGVIAPWNYPMATYFRSVIPALLTGNAVIVKPSEYTPRSALWFAEQLAPYLPPHLLQVIPGDGALGEALVKAGIDACVFTGSTATGKKVQLACVEAGIPVSAEMGGNDPAIVLADCDLDRTVAGLTHWALHNVGQSCGAVEVAFVDSRVADLLVDRLRRAWSNLRVGPGPFGQVDISPLANRRQLQTVQRHVVDAQTKGATLVCGGRPTGTGLFYPPTLLDGCTSDMEVVQEETFGPVLAIVRVGGANEAIERANAMRYGLTASIWSNDVARAERLAQRLSYGVVTVNNHSLTGAMPQLPWSGTRATGYSVANSELALATFTRPRAVVVDTNRDPEPFWMPFDQSLWDLGEALADSMVARVEKVWRAPLLLRKRLQRIRGFYR